MPVWGADAASELRVAVGNFTGERLDPINGGFGMHIYQAPMFDYLVTMTPDRKPTPGIATDWTKSADGKTYTFNLRRGMSWHNGDAVTAADVKFHFERLKTGTGAFIGPFNKNIALVEIVDPHKVVFHLKRPWPDFIDFLGPGDTSVAAITPKKYIEEVGAAAFARKPVGSGPWRLIEHKAGQSFLYESTGGHPFRPEPGFDRLRISLVPEESTRIAMLKRDEVDLINIGFDSIKSVEKAGHRVLDIPNSVLVSVNFIGVWEPRAAELKRPTEMNNAKVRKALYMAINRGELLQYLVLGKGELAERFPAFPGGFGYDKSWEKNRMPYDLAAAKRLMAEAGYPDGFTLRLYSLPMSGAPWLPKMAQVVADYWKRIGVKTELITTEWGAFGPLVYGRPDEALGAAYTWRVTRSSFPIGRMRNYVSADGKALIALVPWDGDHAKVSAETDVAKREKNFQGLMNRLQETNSILPIFYVNALYGANNRLTKWQPFEGWPSIGLSYEYFRPKS